MSTATASRGATASRAGSAAPRRTDRRGALSRALPRRVSGPVGGRARVQPRPQQAASAGARALSLVRALPDHSLIDRLVRGRAWIPVLGVLLTGLVAMQVEILKVGTSLGRSLERTASLQSENESLQAGVAGLAGYQRIERLATGMGMVMPSAGLLKFLMPHPQTQLRAGLANIHAPDPTGFATQLATQMAAAELAVPSTTNASSQASQAAGGQSTAASGSTTAVGATSTTSSQSGTSPAGSGAIGSGSGGGGTSAAATQTAAGTTSAGSATGVGGTTGGSTTGASGATVTPATVTPGAGTSASAGGAGLPTTSTSQSGSSGGG